MISAEVSCSQDLRVWHIWKLYFSWYRNGSMDLTKAHGIDMDSWYRIRLLIQTWTGITMDSWYIQRCLKKSSVWVESLMVSTATKMSLLRRHGSHSPGQMFSLSLVEAKDYWSRFSLSKAGQLIQQWWLPCNFWMAQSPCRLLNKNYQFFFGGGG